MFYFHSKANHHFTLISDANLHINARFIGIRPPNRPRNFTWIQSLGITLSADRAAVWDPTADHLSFTYDNTPARLCLVSRSSSGRAHYESQQRSQSHCRR